MTLPVIDEVPSVSTEYVRAIVYGYESGEQVDPTDLGVWFAFLPEGVSPGLNDWTQGNWDHANQTYFARGLYGPESDVPLDPGDWIVWVRIVSNPERPARRLGILRIT